MGRGRTKDRLDHSSRRRRTDIAWQRSEEKHLHKRSQAKDKVGDKHITMETTTMKNVDEDNDNEDNKNKDKDKDNIDKDSDTRTTKKTPTKNPAK